MTISHSGLLFLGHPVVLMTKTHLLYLVSQLYRVFFYTCENRPKHNAHISNSQLSRKNVINF